MNDYTDAACGLTDRIAGDTSTAMYAKGRRIDITPRGGPAGSTRTLGLENVMTSRTGLSGIGAMQLNLLLREQGAALT